MKKVFAIEPSCFSDLSKVLLLQEILYWYNTHIIDIKGDWFRESVGHLQTLGSTGNNREFTDRIITLLHEKMRSIKKPINHVNYDVNKSWQENCHNLSYHYGCEVSVIGNHMSLGKRQEIIRFEHDKYIYKNVPSIVGCISDLVDKYDHPNYIIVDPYFVDQRLKQHKHDGRIEEIMGNILKIMFDRHGEKGIKCMIKIIVAKNTFENPEMCVTNYTDWMR